MPVQMYSEPAAPEPPRLPGALESLRVFICTGHDGFYPVGVASVVLAENAKQALELLDGALAARGLKTSVDHHYILHQLALLPQAIILNDGNY